MAARSSSSRWRNLARAGLCTLACCLLPAAAAATPTDWVHESWSVRDGLPVNSITQLLQAGDGYLWLATFDGLVRFDGARFSVYNSSNTPGLRHARLSSLRELPDGRLLLGSEAGVMQVFDPAQSRALPLAVIAAQAPATSWRAPDGEVWVSLRPGLGRVRGDAIVAEPELARLDVSALGFDADGSLLLGTGRAGLWRWRDGAPSQELAHATIDVGEMSAILRSADGELWIGGSTGLVRWHAAGPERIGVAGRRHETIFELTQAGERVRVVAESGVYHWDGMALQGIDGVDARRGPLQAGLSATAPGIEVSASAVLSGGRTLLRLADREATRFTFAIRDREGSLWMATLGDGLHRLRPATFSMLGVAEGLSAREVYPLHQDPEGALWIGSQKDGLNRWRDGRIEHFGFEHGLLDDNIRAIASDSAGRLWVATREASLFRATGSGRFEPAPPSTLVPGARIHALYLGRDGTLWTGTDAGLHGLGADGQWHRHPASDALAGCAVRTLREAPDGAFWLATDRCGSIRVLGDSLRRYGDDGRLSDFVRDLLVVDAQTVWIASEDRGIARLRLHADGSASSVALRAEHGLLSDGVHQILEDGHGWWWMGTNRGIFRVRREALETLADRLEAGAPPGDPLAVEIYTEAAGLRDREVNGGLQASALRATDGRLWFATQGGAAIVDPDPVRLARPVRAHIESLSSGEARWPAHAAVELAPEQRRLQFEYTELRQLDARQVQFRHRLVGYDDDWILAGTRRSASYAKVPPGSYVFEVQAHAGGDWKAPVASLALTLRPFFHETAAFRGLLVLLATLVLVLLYRMRVGWLEAQRASLQRLVEARTRELATARDSAEEAARTIAGQAEQLRELDRQKSRFFDDLAHELRTPLTLILGPLREAQRTGDASSAVAGAVRNSERLLDLTNQLLDLARLREGRLAFTPQRGDLCALLRDSAERFAPLAAARGVRFVRRLPDAPVWALLDPRHSGKMVDNLLSNAFKFTPTGGCVELALAVQADGGRIEVSDTGPGIAPELIERVFDRFYQADGSSERLQPGTGIGLALVSDLVTLHSGRLGVLSEDGAGARFHLWLPLVESAGTLATQAVELTPAEPAPSPAPVQNFDEDRTTVLIVDDHREILAQLRNDLQTHYRVVEALDGLDALDQARRLLPDLVVADVSMPRLDGYGLCAQLRQDPELGGLPVILLTARAGIEDRLEGLQAAADDYLTKPYDARELRARVANLLDLRRRLQRQFQQLSSRESAPSTPNVGEIASHWHQRLLAIIDAHLADEAFKVGELADAMGLERTQLFRRVREETGMAPSDLLRERRLQRAASLLLQDPAQIGEIAYAVGFGSVAYFTKCFRERFGSTPGQFRLARDARAA